MDRQMCQVGGGDVHEETPAPESINFDTKLWHMSETKLEKRICKERKIDVLWVHGAALNELQLTIHLVSSAIIHGLP